jgi:hypothetical protein
VKDKVMEWNEQDEAERDGNRDSKSKQCEYAVHKYESGLLNLWKIPAALLLMVLVGSEWNSDYYYYYYYYYLHRAGHAVSPKYKLLKTEMISIKCNKTMSLCRSEDTVDKWC